MMQLSGRILAQHLAILDLTQPTRVERANYRERFRFQFRYALLSMVIYVYTFKATIIGTNFSVLVVLCIWQVFILAFFDEFLFN